MAKLLNISKPTESPCFAGWRISTIFKPGLKRVTLFEKHSPEDIKRFGALVDLRGKKLKMITVHASRERLDRGDNQFDHEFAYSLVVNKYPLDITKCDVTTEIITCNTIDDGEISNLWAKSFLA